MLKFYFFKDEVGLVEIEVDDKYEGRYYLCFQNDTSKQGQVYVHSGNETFQTIYFIKAKRPTILPLSIQIACISATEF